MSKLILNLALHWKYFLYQNVKFWHRYTNLAFHWRCSSSLLALLTSGAIWDHFSECGQLWSFFLFISSEIEKQTSNKENNMNLTNWQKSETSSYSNMTEILKTTHIARKLRKKTTWNTTRQRIASSWQWLTSSSSNNVVPGTSMAQRG